MTDPTLTDLTLTEFLYARFADDARIAERASGRNPGFAWNDTPGSSDRRVAQFLEKWTPARVLAECEKNRRIVALHESWPTLVETPLETETTNDISGYVLRASKQIAWLTTREYVARFGIEPPTAPILALLALPYADHPDYRPEWLP